MAAVVESAGFFPIGDKLACACQLEWVSMSTVHRESIFHDLPRSELLTVHIFSLSFFYSIFHFLHEMHVKPKYFDENLKEKL